MYLDRYQPAYNILKKAGDSTGFNHTPETIAKLQAKHKGKLHPRFGTSPSSEQRRATSEALKAHFAAKGHHNKGKKGILAPQYGLGGNVVHMYSVNGEYVHFPSVNSARISFKVRSGKIADNIDTGKAVTIGGKDWIIYSKPK